MDHNAHIMLARRQFELQERNKEIRKKQLELEQEFNRNRIEISNIYVKLKKSKDAMEAWKGITHGKGYV